MGTRSQYKCKALGGRFGVRMPGGTRSFSFPRKPRSAMGPTEPYSISTRVPSRT